MMLLALAIALVPVLAGTAWASPDRVAAQTQSSLSRELLGNTTFTLSSFGYGPAMGGADEPVPVSIQNQLGLQYLAAPDLTLTPVFDFVYQVNDAAYQGSSARLSLDYDSFLKLYRSNAFEARGDEGSLSVDLDARYYVPTSRYSRDNSSRGSFRLALCPTLYVRGSDWSFGAVTAVRYYLQSRAVSRADPTWALPRWNLYLGPQINYRVAEGMTAWLLYDSYLTVDTRGESTLTSPTALHADFEPGVDFRVNPSFTVSPYLNWYVSQPLKATSINVNATLQI